MILGEVSIGLDTLAGGSVVGMLVAVMAAFMKRTKDVDERRDETSRMIMDAALEREARAWNERDKMLAERDAARLETERIRTVLETERGHVRRSAAAQDYDGRWHDKGQEDK